MEKNDKQINEKQIYSCSTPVHARPNTVRVRFHSQVFPVRKSDSFHNGISTLVTESCTHSKEIQIKETCSGKTGREILSFHACLTGVGKSLLAKHYWNLELISGSILEMVHPSAHHALYKTVMIEFSSVFPHPKIPSFNSASFWPPFFISKLCGGEFTWAFSICQFPFIYRPNFNNKYIFIFIF